MEKKPLKLSEVPIFLNKRSMLNKQMSELDLLSVRNTEFHRLTLQKPIADYKNTKFNQSIFKSFQGTQGVDTDIQS
jgi:hypothetical protein